MNLGEVPDRFASVASYIFSYIFILFCVKSHIEYYSYNAVENTKLSELAAFFPALWQPGLTWTV